MAQPSPQDIANALDELATAGRLILQVINEETDPRSVEQTTLLTLHTILATSLANANASLQILQLLEQTEARPLGL